MGANIALAGRSGSGKTTVADYLTTHYGYYRCSTGLACRTIAKELFNSEEKSTLNRVTDAIKKVDLFFWLRTALSSLPTTTNHVVFDSMRFPDDYVYFRDLGYSLWIIDASLTTCGSRLISRGQDINAGAYENHLAESSLLSYKYDVSLNNDKSLDALNEQLCRAMTWLTGS